MSEDEPLVNHELDGENKVTSELGGAAVEGLVPNLTADDAAKFDKERQANQEGWEATAAELNDRRPLREKLLGKNEETAEGVMVDEAQRANAEIGEWKKDYPYQAKDRSDQEIYDQLKDAEETERSNSRPSFTGYHHGESYGNEPIYTPKKETSNRYKGPETDASASEIRLREKRTKPIAESVIKALESGDIALAEEALAKSMANHFSDETYDFLTMSRYITPALRNKLGEILQSDRTRNMLGELVDTRHLSEFLYFGMAEEAEVPKEYSFRWQPYLIHKAQEILDEKDNLKAEDVEEIGRRLDVLTRVGVIKKEQIQTDHEVRVRAEKLAIKSMASAFIDHPRNGLRLTEVERGLEEMGLVDLRELIDYNLLLQVLMAGELSIKDKELGQRAESALRRKFLEEDESKQAA